jgi:hypothetical protein
MTYVLCLFVGFLIGFGWALCVLAARADREAPRP